jgi:RHS repeat-associated protein
VLDELQSNTVTRSYTWGLQLVSETQLVAATPPASPWQTNWYGFDGHGSVRFLTDSTGAVTDSYDYDAFGNLISSTGTTANNYLFAGEQYDPDLGLYYNRARYLDVRAGRFWGMDTHEGNTGDPLSIHKYLYTGANPVDRVDPSGHDFDLASMAMVSVVGTTIAAMTITALGLNKMGGSGSLPSPTGILVSLRAGLQARGLYGGGGVDLYVSLLNGDAYYAPVVELGSSPLSLFKGYPISVTATVGAAWTQDVSDMAGFGLSAVWPMTFFGTLGGVFAGTNEAFGTLTAIARRTGSPRSTDLAAIVGYSSGAASFQIGLRSNAFGATASYSGEFRRFVPDLDSSVEQLGVTMDTVNRALNAMRSFSSSPTADSYVNLLQEVD